MQPYTDYFDSMAEEYAESGEQAARSSIQARTYAIHDFALFLEARELSLIKVTGDVLRDFRKWALARVKENPRYRGDENRAKATVNIKLKWVYHLLNWCQANFHLPARTIGPTNCKVKSTLPSTEDERNPSKYILGSKQKYPLLYSRTGMRGSAPGTSQHWATEEDVEKIEDQFWEGAALVAMRNTLMLRILDVRGWRISSANSITCHQFSKEEFERQRNRNKFTVTPPRQKNGANRPYEIPWALANRIRKYIDDDSTGRKAIVEKVGANCQVETDNVFPSTDRGKALPSKEWSSIFGKIFKKIDAPKGTGAHALRRGAGQRHAERLIESLFESGLPVTAETVTTELMQFLGHSTREAQAAYLMGLRRRYGRSQIDQLASSLESKKLENDELKAELARVKAENEALAEANALLRKGRLTKVKQATPARRTTVTA
jgi:integrase